MSKIYIDEFAGIRPRVDPKLLRENEALTARNCRMLAGVLTPLNGTTLSAASGASCALATQSIFKWKYAGNTAWQAWDNDVDVVPAPDGGDDIHRFYFTGNGVPKVRYYEGGNVLERNLSQPTPTVELVVTAEDEDVTGMPDFESGNVSLTGYYRVEYAVQPAGYPDTADAEYNSDLHVIVANATPTVQFDEETGGYILHFTFPTTVLTTWFGTMENVQITSVVLHIYSIQLYAGGQYFLPDDIFTVTTGSDDDLKTHNVHVDFNISKEAVTVFAQGQSTFMKGFSGTIIIDPHWVDKDSGSERYFTYRQTFVNDWGWEGPPGTATDPVKVLPRQNITVTVDTSGSDAYTTASRIYRAEVDSYKLDDDAGSKTTKNYYLVKEVPITEGVTFDYVDTKKDFELYDRMPDLGNPPSDLEGLVALPNGFLAAFHANAATEGTDAAQKREVCFSNQWMPHAWPTKYRAATDADIVGLGVADGTLCVLTKGHPHVALGSNPANMTLGRLAAPHTCISKKSICTARGTLFYASPDGIVRMTGGGAELLTENHYSRSEWQTLVPSTMWTDIVMRYHNGALVAFFGAAGGGIIFDLASSNLIVTTTDYTGYALYRDVEDDSLYVLATHSSGLTREIRSWDTDTTTPMTATWKSRNFASNRLLNWNSCRVVANAYTTPLTLNFYSEGALAGTLSISSQTSRRIPKYKPQRDWNAELVTKHVVDVLAIGSSMSEIV